MDGLRSQIAVDGGPRDGGDRAIEVRRAPEEPAPGVLLFDRAVRQIDVGLSGDLPRT